MLPMPCDECESCRWMREIRGHKYCTHERPETDSRGAVRVCLTYERRKSEDLTALFYDNADVDPRR